MVKILVVVDMQNDFINGSLGTEEAQVILPKVIDKVKNHEGEIVVTFDTHETNYLDTQEGKNLPVEHCVIDTIGWELPKELDAVVPDEAKRFTKPTFGSKELAEYLSEINEESGIDSIELVGLCTDICVISNALLFKAFMPEVKVSVDSSCCAGVTPESHNNAINAMKMCQIEIRGVEI